MRQNFEVGNASWEEQINLPSELQPTQPRGEPMRREIE